MKDTRTSLVYKQLAVQHEIAHQRERIAAGVDPESALTALADTSASLFEGDRHESFDELHASIIENEPDTDTIDDEDADYSLSGWQEAVAQDHTRLGYRDWIAQQKHDRAASSIV